MLQLEKLAVGKRQLANAIASFSAWGDIYLTFAL